MLGPAHPDVARMLTGRAVLLHNQVRYQLRHWWLAGVLVDYSQKERPFDVASVTDDRAKTTRLMSCMSKRLKSGRGTWALAIPRWLPDLTTELGY